MRLPWGQRPVLFVDQPNMNILGNILLFLALLAAGDLFKMTFLQKMPGGDYGVGYARVVLFLIAFFWGCMALTALIIGYHGGFSWLALGRFGSNGMLALCFLVMFLGVTLGMEASFRNFRFLAPINAVATPLVLMLSFAVLLNEGLKTLISPNIVKWGLTGIFAINTLVLATMLLGKFASRVGAFLPRSDDNLSSFELGIMARIDSCNPSEGITSLFLYAGDNQPRPIREKARLKIKSKPDWQDDLYHALEGDEVDAAMRFLYAIEVDDKTRFAKGVYQGVLTQARLVRERYRNCSHPSHVYDGMFAFEVQRCIQIVNKFSDAGVDFKPAMQELRAALDEPNAYGHDQSCKNRMDKWLRKH